MVNENCFMISPFQIYSSYSVSFYVSYLGYHSCSNILIHTVFSWHLLSFLLFIKLLYVMYFLWQKKQSVISSMRILSLTCIFWLLKCFRALSFCVGRSKNAIYGLFCSHYIFWNLSSLFPPPASEVSKL